jgi:hypothetical protein
MQGASATLQEILNGPALPPPTGFDPDQHWGRDNTLYFVTSFCMAIEGLMITLRMYTQWRIKRTYESADCTYCPLLLMPILAHS